MNRNELIALKESLTKKRERKYVVCYPYDEFCKGIFTEQEIRERSKTDIEKVIPLLENNFEAAIRFLSDINNFLSETKDYDAMNIPIYLGEFVVGYEEIEEIWKPLKPIEKLEDFLCIDFPTTIEISLNNEMVECKDFDIPEFDDKTKLFVSRSALIAKLEENGYIVQDPNHKVEIRPTLDFKKRTLKPCNFI